MNGEINLHSTVGMGSEFLLSITFEIGQSNNASLQEKEMPILPNSLNILVADDSSINRMVFEKQLNSMEIDFSMAKNGLEALHLLSSLKFDIILLDIQMPVMDGVEFLN